MKRVLRMIALLALMVIGCHGYSRETFRGRLNPNGAAVAENLISEMIGNVNDLIKKYAVIKNLQVGPVTINTVRMNHLNTGRVSLNIRDNKLGFSMHGGSVNVVASYTAVIQLLFFSTRISGSVHVSSNGINADLAAKVGVSGGKLHVYSKNDVDCRMDVGQIRVNLHNHLLNHVANSVVHAFKAPIMSGVCQGVQLYGRGMVNSIFETLPTNINVFNLFHLELPMVNFRSWDRHLAAGLGMEVRPVDNLSVNYQNIRLLPMKGFEDGHMACASISDFIVNTASRTLLPVGDSYDVDVGSLMTLFVKNALPFKIVVRGTITASPLFLVEKDEISFTVKTSGTVLDKNGKESPFLKNLPAIIKVTAPTKETPLFNRVHVQVSGAFKISTDVDLSTILDYIVSQIDSLFNSFGALKVRRSVTKRATGNDLTRAIKEMFVGQYLSGFDMKLSAEHGELKACVNGSPTGKAKQIILNALRASFSS